MRKKLYLNNTDLSTYGIFINSDTYLNSPLIDYTEFQIPARDGSAILDNKRLNNVMRRFDCYVPDVNNIDTALKAVKKIIYANRGYIKIASDYDPLTYQYGYFAEELNVEPFRTKSATFSLFFSCLPRKIFKTDTTGTYSTSVGGIIGEESLTNDDPIIVSLLSKATKDYPTSIFGWSVYKVNYPLQSYYNNVLNSSSTTTKQYMIVGKNTNTGGYRILSEITNYKLEEEFTYSGSQSYDLYVFSPILHSNESIYVDVKVYDANYVLDDEWDITFTYNWASISISDFTNLDAFDCDPVFLLKHGVNDNSSCNSSSDLYCLNGNEYVIDFHSFTTDYGNKKIKSNYVQTDGGNKYLYVLVDFKKGEAYLLKTFDFDGDVLLDISNYFYCKNGVIGDSLTVKKGSQYTAVLLSDLFITNMVYAIKYKMGWWSL
jgi:hypothetical protein